MYAKVALGRQARKLTVVLHEPAKPNSNRPKQEKPNQQFIATADAMATSSVGETDITPNRDFSKSRQLLDVHELGSADVKIRCVADMPE